MTALDAEPKSDDGATSESLAGGQRVLVAPHFYQHDTDELLTACDASSACRKTEINESHRPPRL
jgi:hypothetical protein